jgi:hypothetical protein
MCRNNLKEKSRPTVRDYGDSLKANQYAWRIMSFGQVKIGVNLTSEPCASARLPCLKRLISVSTYLMDIRQASRVKLVSGQ